LENDPLAGLKATAMGFRQIGQSIARLGPPTATMQEGGYLSDGPGANLAVLAELEAAR
jgi:acetoin utilization deacetylase AcuC-like enzyme